MSARDEWTPEVGDLVRDGARGENAVVEESGDGDLVLRPVFGGAPWTPQALGQVRVQARQGTWEPLW